jgi:hypothetical protein
MLRLESVRTLRRVAPCLSTSKHGVILALATLEQSFTSVIPLTGPLWIVPLDKSAIQSVTPSQIYGWEGLGADVDLTPYSEATPQFGLAL